MNGKTAKMLRKMKANDRRSKRLYTSLTPAQRTKVRATYKTDGAEEATVKFAELLRV